MTIEFRIREHKFSNGIIHFIPEKTIPSKIMFRNYEWTNISEPGGYTYCTTYDEALEKIKKFCDEYNLSALEFDRIHELPNLTMTFNRDERNDFK
jgi:hypothetical protein